MPPYLTSEERDRIAHLRSRGAHQKEIADALQRARSTIRRELKPNGKGDEYYAAQAQRMAERRRPDHPLARKMDDPLINEFVRERLAHEWSPEEITGRLEQQSPQEPNRRVSVNPGIHPLHSRGREVL